MNEPAPVGLVTSFTRSCWLLPVVIFLTVALNFPALRFGFIFDDYVQLNEFRNAGPVMTAMNLFAFIPNEAKVRQLRELGVLPWWTTDQLKLSFWRPAASITHWIDYKLWQNHPAMYHAQSIFWAALMVMMAAILYRRFLGCHPVALLAIVLYLLDDAHHMPIAWLANRNSVIATFWGLAALWAHDRWRAQNEGCMRWFALTFFALALLSGEFGAGAGALMLSYALFLDNRADTWKARLLSILPYVVLGAIWLTYYSVAGYGASGSRFYVDPMRSPLRFISATVISLPILMEAQWGPISSDLRGAFSTRLQYIDMVISVAWTVGMIGLFIPLLRQSRLARFFFGISILCLLPVAATAPSDRLLLLSTFGGFGILAMLMLGVCTKADWVPKGATRWVYRAACIALIAIHGLVAPLSYRARIGMFSKLNTFVVATGRSLPVGSDPDHQTLVSITTPGPFFFATGLMAEKAEGKIHAKEALGIASAYTAVTVERIDEATLRVSPKGGFLQPHGSWSAAPDHAPPVHSGYLVQVFEGLYRDPSVPFHPGDTTRVAGGATVTVDRLNVAGRPASVLVHFPVPLEDKSLVWVAFAGDGYVGWHPPAVGQSDVIQPKDMRLF